MKTQPRASMVHRPSATRRPGRWAAATVAVALLAAVLAACGPAQTPPNEGAAPVPQGAMPSSAAPPEGTPPADAPPGDEAAAPGKPLTIGVMPKLMGIDFFNAAERGAKEAGQELGVTVDYDGPVNNDVQLQVQKIETWIAKKYDAIAVAPNDPDAIAPVLLKARKRGIKVVAWDADARKDARDFFVNQCTSESVARTLMDVVAKGAGPECKYLIITGSLTAANQNIWMAEMEKYRQTAYPKMTNLSETPQASEEDQALATQVMTDCLTQYKDVQGVFAITSVALPGAAEALRKAGAADRVFLTGLATPNAMRSYVTDGTVKQFVLWNAVDLGYLAVRVAVAATRGELAPGAAEFAAGRIGTVRLAEDQVILGEPIIFDKDNISRYDF